jgi:predicted DNA-binding protein
MWYGEGMAKSATSSYRLDAQTMAELTEVSQRLGKGKNAIIVEAIRDYLRRTRSNELIDEARRQSLAASDRVTNDESFWHSQFDERGWK